MHALRGQARTAMREPPSFVTDGAAARLKNDIDRGRTGDKVAWPDPAAAPLGTDDEAGGNCATSETVERTRQAEIARGRVPPQSHHGLGATWLLISPMLVAALAIVLFVR
jgi:hypothetical protein